MTSFKYQCSIFLPPWSTPVVGIEVQVSSAGPKRYPQLTTRTSRPTYGVHGTAHDSSLSHEQQSPPCSNSPLHPASRRSVAGSQQIPAETRANAGKNCNRRARGRWRTAASPRWPTPTAIASADRRASSERWTGSSQVCAATGSRTCAARRSPVPRGCAAQSQR